MSKMAKKLTDALESNKNFNLLYEQMLHALMPDPDLRNKMMKLIEACKEDLLDVQVKVYDELFSENELEELAEIYSKQSMRKFLNKSPEVQRRIDYYAKEIIFEKSKEFADNTVDYNTDTKLN